MSEIAGLPFWELTFDADGDPDAAGRDAFLAGLPGAGLTDLIVFSHGWNNDRGIALRLYQAFFGVLAGQLPAGRKVGLAGVLWPSQRWSDEPIPDFAAPAGPGAGGAAAVAAAPGGETVDTPELDPRTLAGLEELFPAATGPLQRIAALLAGPATKEALEELHAQMSEFARLAGSAASAGDDGEDGRDRAGLDPAEPGMLMDPPAELFERYAERLQQAGVVFAGDGAGEAGIGDVVRGALHGAKEALRQLTYWQMKNRAGTVGRSGLGPLLGRAREVAPGLRVHLVGHSFGARLVSYALQGLPAGPSPVGSLTLLEGAFSQWVFASRLPFDAGRHGGLAGIGDRVDGPLAVCFSSHDGAVGTFYPLASMAARDDTAGIGDAGSRWGGIGANGAQGAGARTEGIRGAGPGVTYPFEDHRILNIDASDVVRAGGPPSGAHSDIVHPELTWVVLLAGRLAG